MNAIVSASCTYYIMFYSIMSLSFRWVSIRDALLHFICANLEIALAFALY